MWATRTDNARPGERPTFTFLLVDRRGDEERRTVVHAGSETTARRAYDAWLTGKRVPLSAQIVGEVAEDFAAYDERIVLRIFRRR